MAAPLLPPEIQAAVVVRAVAGDPAGRAACRLVSRDWRAAVRATPAHAPIDWGTSGWDEREVLAKVADHLRAGRPRAAECLLEHNGYYARGRDPGHLPAADLGPLVGAALAGGLAGWADRFAAAPGLFAWALDSCHDGILSHGDSENPAELAAPDERRRLRARNGPLLSWVLDRCPAAACAALLSRPPGWHSERMAAGHEYYALYQIADLTAAEASAWEGAVLLAELAWTVDDVAVAARLAEAAAAACPPRARPQLRACAGGTAFIAVMGHNDPMARWLVKRALVHDRVPLKDFLIAYAIEDGAAWNANWPGHAMSERQLFDAHWNGEARVFRDEWLAVAVKAALETPPRESPAVWAARLAAAAFDSDGDSDSAPWSGSDDEWMGDGHGGGIRRAPARGPVDIGRLVAEL